MTRGAGWFRPPISAHHEAIPGFEILHQQKQHPIFKDKRLV
jgi:hypothetical protein